MIPHHVLRLWLVLATGLLIPMGRMHATPLIPRVVRSSALILEGGGLAGPFKIGDAVARYADLLKQVPREPRDVFSAAAGVYLSADSSFRVTTTSDGMIQTVEVSNPAAFTTRLIRPGASTVSDVLAKYGQDYHVGYAWFTRRYFPITRIILVYAAGKGTIAFAFEVDRGPAAKEREALARAKVRSITLGARAPKP
jgi:hypothetical protein